MPFQPPQGRHIWQSHGVSGKEWSPAPTACQGHPEAKDLPQKPPTCSLSCGSTDSGFPMFSRGGHIASKVLDLVDQNLEVQALVG